MKQNKEQNNMKVVGITGGVGSGKSVVMNILKEKYAAEVNLADIVAHDLMEPGQQNYLTGRHWQNFFLEIRNDSPV